MHLKDFPNQMQLTEAEYRDVVYHLYCYNTNKIVKEWRAVVTNGIHLTPNVKN
jgi:hypothetical protein